MFKTCSEDPSRLVPLKVAATFHHEGNTGGVVLLRIHDMGLEALPKAASDDTLSQSSIMPRGITNRMKKMKSMENGAQHLVVLPSNWPPHETLRLPR